VLLKLPGDLTSTLQAQELQQQEKDAKCPRQGWEQRCAMDAMLHKVLAADPHGVTSSSHRAGGSVAAQVEGLRLDVKAEAERLRGMALTAARELARVRAINKQQVAAAAAGLAEEGGRGLVILDGSGR
jgi:hypothetical protein